MVRTVALVMAVAMTSACAIDANAATGRARRPGPPPAADPIHRIIQLGRANMHRAKIDQFAAASPIQGAGEAFKLILQPVEARPSNNSPSGTPLWSYGSGVLSFSWDYQLGSEQVAPNQLLIDSRSVSGRSYRVSNAFGATGDVEVSHNLLNAIALTNFEPQQFSLDMDVAGEEARQLSRSVVIIVEGVVAAFPDGSSVRCEESELGPSMDFLEDVHDDTCAVAVHVSRIAFVNRNTGAVLKELAP